MNLLQWKGEALLAERDDEAREALEDTLAKLVASGQAEVAWAEGAGSIWRLPLQGIVVEKWAPHAWRVYATERSLEECVTDAFFENESYWNCSLSEWLEEWGCEAEV